jgi:hypothetical protein
MNLCVDWVRLGLGPFAAWMELGMCSEFSDRAAEADGNCFFFLKKKYENTMSTAANSVSGLASG